MTRTGRGRVFVIASEPRLIARLLPTLAQASLGVHVLEPRSNYLRRSKYVIGHTLLPDEPDVRHAILRSLVEQSLRPEDWVVCASDDVMWDIGDSDLPLEAKVRLLPIMREHGLNAVTSKIGMAEALAQCGARQRDFEVAVALADLPAAAARLGYPVIVKTNRGASGDGIGVLRTPEDDFAPRVPSLGPYLIERFVEGELMAVEALYLRGRLVAMAYSHCIETAGAFGVSIVREYRELDDSVLKESLGKLGECIGLDGFANISMIRCVDGTHAIFEVDVRPNAWHAYLPKLGLDLGAAVSSRLIQGAEPPSKAFAMVAVIGKSVRNLTRTIVYQGRIAGLFAVLKLSGMRITFPYANFGDWRISLNEQRRLLAMTWRNDWKRIRRIGHFTLRQ